jgi:hypothetical protein
MAARRKVQDPFSKEKAERPEAARISFSLKVQIFAPSTVAASSPLAAQK